MNDIVKYEKIVKYEDYLDEQIPERRFKLVYANKEFFYLTQEERDFFLNQLNHGLKYVQIGENTFTGGFIALYPIKPKFEKKEYVEVAKGVLKEV